MMTHENVLERLDDYVDGRLSEDDALALDAHLGGCAACRAELDALEALLDEARALPAEIAPSRDLWAGIEARIRPAEAPAPVVEEDAKVTRLVPRAQRWAPRWALQAAAAVLLVVTSSLVTARVIGRAPAPGGTLPGAVVSAPAPNTAFAAFQPAEREYQKAIGELEVLLQTRRGEMAPETAATLERNLAIIDEAIRQSREALLKDPNSRALTQMLSSVYDQKLQTLQRVVQM